MKYTFKKIKLFRELSSLKSKIMKYIYRTFLFISLCIWLFGEYAILSIKLEIDSIGN